MVVELEAGGIMLLWITVRTFGSVFDTETVAHEFLRVE